MGRAPEDLHRRAVWSQQEDESLGRYLTEVHPKHENQLKHVSVDGWY